MKPKTIIIIILIIAIAAFVGYKWYASKKEDKGNEEPKHPKEPNNKEELPEGYLEAKEVIGQHLKDAAKNGQRIEIQYGRNKNEIAIFDKSEYSIIDIIKVATNEAFNLLNDEYHFQED